MSSTGTKAAIAGGGVLFAGTMMIISGLFQAFQGISGIAKDDILLSTPNYVYKFNTTTWGWIHLILGIIIAVVGYLVITGSTVGRMTALVLVSVQAITNFFYLPYYPLWALVIIALDIFVIWALCVSMTRDA